jgi:hypothetical protein
MTFVSGKVGKAKRRRKGKSGRSCHTDVNAPRGNI